jgi:hypothetical protein
MKNHLSIEASIFSGGRSALGGRGGSCAGETRLGECSTVKLVLRPGVSGTGDIIMQGGLTHVETLPGCVLPVIRRSQASAHSRTTSMAYLRFTVSCCFPVTDRPS